MTDIGSRNGDRPCEIIRGKTIAARQIHASQEFAVERIAATPSPE
ncbi:MULTISPECIES: hypothetical protein [unclassified Actinoplanes]|nr:MULTISPECIES: hypothetical protein [unclassified Actinoplanes]